MSWGPGKAVWVLCSAVSCFHASGYWVLWFGVFFPSSNDPQWNRICIFLSPVLPFYLCYIFFFQTLTSLASEQKTWELLNRITLKWWFNWAPTHDKKIVLFCWMAVYGGPWQENAKMLSAFISTESKSLLIWSSRKSNQYRKGEPVILSVFIFANVCFPVSQGRFFPQDFFFFLYCRDGMILQNNCWHDKIPISKVGQETFCTFYRSIFLYNSKQLQPFKKRLMYWRKIT